MITATILFIISIFSSRVTVNVLVFVLRVVFFSSNCVYRDAIHVRCCASGFFTLSASFVLERFDGSEVTTREGKTVLWRK